MWTREFWLFVNTFADWVSAAGTIGAIAVALYLARRDARISLRVRAGLWVLVQAGVDARPEYFSLDVTNVGRRPARITNLLMKDGYHVRIGRRWRLGSTMFIVPPANAVSSPLPTTLNDGERAAYMLPWPDFERANRDLFRSHFRGALGYVRARLFRMGVDTSAAGPVYVRVSRDLAERLAQMGKQ